MTISPGDGGSGRSRHPPPLSPPPPLTLRGRTPPPPRADSGSRCFRAGDGGERPLGTPRSSTRRARSGTSARTFLSCPHPSVASLSPTPSPSYSHPSPVSVPIPFYPMCISILILISLPVAMPCRARPCHASGVEHLRGRRAATPPHPISGCPPPSPGAREKQAALAGHSAPSLSPRGALAFAIPSAVFRPDEFPSTPSPQPPAGTKAKAFAPFSGTRGGCG